MFWLQLLTLLVLLLTAAIVFWYSLETRGLRKQAAEQNEILRRQLRLAEASQAESDAARRTAERPVLRLLNMTSRQANHYQAAGGRAPIELNFRNEGSPFRALAVSCPGLAAQLHPLGQLLTKQNFRIDLQGRSENKDQPMRLRLEFEDHQGRMGATTLVYDMEKNSFHQEGCA